MTQKIYKIKAGSAVSDGDMFKSVYDTNANDIVDNSEKLGNQLPAFYDQNAHVASLLLHLSSDERDALTAASTPTTSNPIATIDDINSLAILSVGGTSPIISNEISGAVTISHSIADGNKHVTATGTTSDGKILTAGATTGSFSWQLPQSVTTTWLALTDTDPTTYVGQGGKGVRVNSVPDGLEFYDITDTNYYLSSSSFSTITGDLSFTMSGATTVNDVSLDGRYAYINHIHSTYDYSAAALTGAVIFSDINVTDGIVDGQIATRTLTLANLGYTGATDADNYSSWTIKDGDTGTIGITSGDSVKFVEGTGIDVNFTDIIGPDFSITLTNTAPNIVQTITLTGDVTGTGTGSFATTISTDAVDIAMLSATGIASSATYLRGDNTWNTPPNDNDDNYADSLAFATGTGVLTIGRTGALIDLTQDLDGRYELIGTNDNYSSWTATDGTVSGGIASGELLEFNGVNGISAAMTTVLGTTKVLTLTNTLPNVVQTITLTGDVTGSGTGSFATTIGVDKVDIPMLSATGTASSSTYLRGDNTWATIVSSDTWRPVTAGGNTLGAAETLAFTNGTGINITELAGAVTITATTLGTVTSVGTNAPLTGTVTTSGNLSITQAGSLASGYLSNTDWNTFNNKTSNIGDITAVNITAGNGLTGSVNTPSGTHTQTLAPDYTSVTNIILSAPTTNTITSSDEIIWNDIFDSTVHRATVSELPFTNNTGTMSSWYLRTNTDTPTTINDGETVNFSEGAGLLSSLSSNIVTYEVNYTNDVDNIITAAALKSTAISNADAILVLDDGDGITRKSDVDNLPFIQPADGYIQEDTTDTKGAIKISTLDSTQYTNATKSSTTLYFIVGIAG